MITDDKSWWADRVASFIIGASIISALVMVFFDWRFSVLAALIIWNQTVFKIALRGEKTGIQMSLSLGVILIFVWHFFITY